MDNPLRNLTAEEQLRIAWILVGLLAGIEIVFLMTMPECKPDVCWYDNGNGRVYGPCDNIFALKNITGWSLIHNLPQQSIAPENLTPIIIHQKTECPPVPECPLCQECQTCQVCPTCETCQVCPEMIIPADIQKKHLNLGPKEMANKAPAEQHGYYECLVDTWELYDTPNRPKFFPGPSNSIKDFYDTLTGNNIKDEGNTTCIRLYKDNMGEYLLFNRTPDTQGRDRWGWNDDNCKSSSIRINHL